MTDDWYAYRAKKNELWSLIKRVGIHWHEDSNALREYGAEVYETWKQDLDRAIECFKNLAEQCRWVKPGDFGWRRY